MVQLFLSLTAALLASASAFTAPSTRVVGVSKTMLKAGEIWDPMGFYELGSGEAFDTFPGVFPDKQYLQASEIKQGRMAMLAWTGIWATTKVCNCQNVVDIVPYYYTLSTYLPTYTDTWLLFPNLFQGGLGLGLHFPGFPEDSDWTTALGTFATEQPAWFGGILAFICIAEGESVGHSGDNFRGKSTKDDQGNLNFDYLGLKKSLKPEKYARYQEVELKVSPVEINYICNYRYFFANNSTHFICLFYFLIT